MDRRLMFYLVFAAIFLLIELYVYFVFKSLVQNPRYQKIFNFVYLAQSLFLLFAFVKVAQGMMEGSALRTATNNFYIGILFSAFVFKLLICGMMLTQDGVRFIAGIGSYITGLFTGNQPETFFPERRKMIATTAILVSSVPFLSMLYGITKGKYRYTVSRLSLAFSNLPKNFDGLKVVQISDIHSGSFDSVSEVEKGIKMINDLKPDLILFTGDLVNSLKDEINPYVASFEKLKATHGKYAILGNHDYYGLNGVAEENKDSYWADFMNKYVLMGFKLLKNEHTKIIIGDQEISLVGVENWGAGRFFQKYGDIDKSIAGMKSDDFAIMMSHDPTHWSQHIVPHKYNFPLTLSGHTHGMQFGIDVPGFKWSPVKYRYAHWSGLYEDKGQYLYVNKGFGFLGFPGRVGMWPEITLIELKSVT